MSSALKAPRAGGGVTAPSPRRLLAPLRWQEEAEGAGETDRGGGGGERGPERARGAEVMIQPGRPRRGSAVAIGAGGDGNRGRGKGRAGPRH